MEIPGMGWAAWRGWMHLGATAAQMHLAAGEVIWRRGLLMAQGNLSGIEAARMVTEKPAAFALGAQRAAMAAIAGRAPETVAAAALRPIRTRTRANARRLRP